MSSMRNHMMLALLLAAGGTAAAQDTIRVRDKDGKITEIPQGPEVVSLSSKTVEYEIDLGNTRAKQPLDARTVVEIVPDANGRTFDFNQGEQAFGSGDMDEAITRFDRVRKDQRARELLRQLAAIYQVRAHWAKGDPAGTVAAARSLRQERPDSFFVRESFVLEVKAHLARNDASGASTALQQFEEKGKSDGMTEWAKTAEIMRGGLLELQGKHRDALAIHRKYVRDREVGEDAQMGELRCLTAIGDLSGASSRADSILSEHKNKKDSNPRLLMGAYNARGEAQLKAGKIKDALFDFLQGVMVLSKSQDGSPEHEAALAGGTIACAKLALAEKDKKEVYKERAQELLRDLQKYYPGSRLQKEAQAAVQSIK